MEKEDFDSLLQRYLTDKVTDEEKLKIESWLDAMKTENRDNLVLSKHDEDTLFNKIKANTDLTVVTEFRPMITPQWIKVAASIMLVLTFAFSLWYFGRSTSNVATYVAAADGEKIILDDGTIVWLHKGSSISYHKVKDAPIRNAELTGEALFEVAKDPRHPFVIKCGNINVRVLGTSFNLLSGANNVELKVLTGKVNLSSSSDLRGVDIGPQETITYKPDGNFSKSVIKPEEIAEIPGMALYNMSFVNATMENVLKKIEQKFGVTVDLKNQQINECHVTADFTDHSMETTMLMISELLNINYRIDGEKISITGVGCK